tara:strand:+ start:429 stop:2099 length:1671 start_codon:yes stop_codon:yes gene_type:complete
MSTAQSSESVKLQDATHVVGDPDGAAVLERLGFASVVASRTEQAIAEAMGAMQPTVLIGKVGDLLRQGLHDADLDVFEIASVSSPTTVLGFSTGPAAKQWTLAEIEEGKRTWCSYLDSARRADPPENVDESGTINEFVQPRRAASAPWPAPLSNKVRVGLMADVLDAVEQETEADPAAIVFDFIARVGCLVGRGPHFSISADRHGTNAFVLIVGSTGSGRKGTSAAYPRVLARIADPALQTQSGMSSGEGLIETIKDERIVGINKDGSDKIEPGVTDKRVLVTEAEFARTLKASSRRDNTLSTLIRLAWDSRTLSTMTKQPYKATDPHVSIIGHITPEELRSLLSSNDISGGTANRFLFVASKKSRTLPYGGHVSDDVLDRLGTILRDLVDYGRCNRDMQFTEQAHTEWAEHYATLARDEAIGGVAGQVLARGVPQVRRLAMIFAILDRSRDVDSHHVRAAMEAWRFSRDSVLHVFGVRTGNRLADLIHDELRLAEGEQLTRAEIRSIAGSNVSGAEIEDALATLQTAEIAYGQRRKTGQRGKPAEVWRLHANVKS